MVLLHKVVATKNYAEYLSAQMIWFISPTNNSCCQVKNNVPKFELCGNGLLF